MENFVLILNIILAILLIGSVLLQKSEGGALGLGVSQDSFMSSRSAGSFLTKSTANTRETIEVDGETYPLVKLEISRASHPFYTGKSKLVDTAGRIDKFKNKYKKFAK